MIFFLSFSSLIARYARNFGKQRLNWDIFQYAHLFIGVGQIMKIIRNSSYTSDGIFSWSQIYIQCLFLVCCMRFLWVFLHFIFFGWIYYEFRKRILNKCLCVYDMHIIWPFYDTIDSCCMQFTKTRKIMCLLRHCACLIICIFV